MTASTRLVNNSCFVADLPFAHSGPDEGLRLKYNFGMLFLDSINGHSQKATGFA